MLLTRPTVISVAETYGKRRNSSVMLASRPNSSGACSNGELHTPTGQRASNTLVTLHPERCSHWPHDGLNELHIRSEERRVGKECRSRWLQDHEKKKKD